jgi:CheY-like chemotaxis protein
MLEKLHFDLIFAEYWLPAMKGEEFAALVRQKWPDQPIILMTANIQDFHHDDHPIPGVDCLLNKPFTISQLREALLWVLDRYVEHPPASQMSPADHPVHQETQGAFPKAPTRKYER